MLVWYDVQELDGPLGTTARVSDQFAPARKTAKRAKQAPLFIKKICSKTKRLLMITAEYMFVNELLTGSWWHGGPRCYIV